MSLVLTLVLIVTSIVFYVYAPDLVPIRFNGVGEVSSWGPKGICFVLTVVGALGGILLLWAAYDHKYVNIPARIRPECRMHQLVLVGKMARIVAVIFNLLFLSILFSMAVVSFHLDCPWHGLISDILGAMLLMVILVFTVWINRVGRR